jgi:3-phenylpropionate/trans-cinnamate dioxygenase ferredoxin component
MGDQIECPKHNERFNIRTGAALRAPVRVNLATYPARIAGDRIEILI